MDFVGHVEEQLGEVGYFEYLVQREELQGCDAGAFQNGREGPVGEGALGFFFDHGELGGVGSGESVWEGEFEGGCGDVAGCDAES